MSLTGDSKSCFLSRRYESTSSDDSSSESSDEGSDSSEYHEAREKLPESTVQHQQLTPNEVSQPSDSTSVAKPTAANQPSPNQPATGDTRHPDKPFQSPATDCPPAADGIRNPASTATRADQSREKRSAASPSTDHASEQTSTMSTTVQAEQQPAAESSDTVCAPAKPVRVELSASLVSALQVLQKALGEPNAFSHQAAVSVFNH